MLARLCLLLCLAAMFIPLSAHEPPPRMLLLDAARSGESIVAVGERGTILRSDDNAKSWQRVAAPLRAALTGIDFASGEFERGWAVGHDAVILATTDGGRTWTKQFQDKNPEESFLDVLAIDARNAIAIGAYGLFQATADGGRTWLRRKIREGDEHLNRVSRRLDGELFIAGERGTLLRSSDAGANWRPIPAPYQGSFYGIVPLDRRTLLAYGLEGRLFRSVDDGLSWQAIVTPRPVLLAAAVQLKSNYIYVSGYAQTLLLSKDYGKTFAPSPAASSKGVAGLLELPDGSVLAVGDGGVTVLPRPW